MEEKKLNSSNIIGIIIHLIILGFSGSLAVILGILLGNFYPKLNVNKPLLIKAYQTIISQEVSTQEVKSFDNSFLFNKEETEISYLGKEVLNDLIKEIETQKVSVIRIKSYTEKGGDTPLKLATLVKQYLEKNLTKDYRFLVTGYGLEKNNSLNTKIEIILK